MRVEDNEGNDLLAAAASMNGQGTTDSPSAEKPAKRRRSRAEASAAPLERRRQALKAKMEDLKAEDATLARALAAIYALDNGGQPHGEAA